MVADVLLNLLGLGRVTKNQLDLGRRTAQLNQLGLEPANLGRGTAQLNQLGLEPAKPWEGDCSTEPARPRAS